MSRSLIGREGTRQGPTEGLPGSPGTPGWRGLLPHWTPAFTLPPRSALGPDMGAVLSQESRPCSASARSLPPLLAPLSQCRSQSPSTGCRSPTAMSLLCGPPEPPAGLLVCQRSPGWGPLCPRFPSTPGPTPPFRADASPCRLLRDASPDWPFLISFSQHFPSLLSTSFPVLIL